MTGDELDRAIQFLLESQAKLTSESARQRTDLNETKLVIAQFAESTALWAQKADERISRVEKAMQDFGAGMNKLDARMNQLTVRMDQLTVRMDQLTVRMDEMAGSMNALIHVVEGHVTDDRRHRTPPGQ